MDSLIGSLISPGFLPHGHCFLWTPTLLWGYVLFDGLIAAAYFSIPVAIWQFVRRRRDVPFRWMFHLFAVFILACGATHLLDVWNLWHGAYWLDFGLKGITAAASVGTALAAWPLIPRALSIPTARELQETNARLAREIEARADAEVKLQELNRSLEERVEQRTAQWRVATEELRMEMVERVRVADALHESEERLRLALEANRDGVWDWTAKSGLAWLSPRYLEMTGYSRDEIVPDFAFFELTVHPEDREMVRWMVNSQLDGTVDTSQFEYRLVQKSGEARWTSARTRIVSRDPTGKPLRMVGTISDIDERKRAEQELALWAQSFHKANLEVAIADARTNCFIAVNAAFARRRGYEPAELAGRPLDTVVPADLVPMLRERAAATDRSSHEVFEYEHMTRDGRRFPVLMDVTSIAGADGSPERRVAYALDITERVRARGELESHRTRLEDLVRARTAELSELYNRAPCGYHSLNADGLYLSVNDTELAWLGYTREEVVGRLRGIDTIVPEQRDFYRSKFSELLATGELSGTEVDFVRKDGTTVPGLVHSRAVYDDSGSFSHCLSTVTDNTARKEAQRAWAAAREAAESASEAKSQFLANMSHEIRTPLNAIIGFGHIISRGTLEPVQRERLGKVAAAAQHLLALVNDILDLSKIEAGMVVLDRVEFDVSQVATNVSALLQERAIAKGVAVDVRCVGLDYRVSGDATRFTQAVLNLMANAVKFSDKGSVNLRMVQEERIGNRVLIRTEVTDSGIGIAPDLVPKLFSAFSQGDASISRKFGGTGLGLAITKRIAQLMGGEVGVRSQEGVGSTFWFTAWLEICGAATLAAESAPAMQSQEERLARNYRGSRILIAEDDPLSAEVAATFLTDLGLDVQVAANGEAAVAAATRETFDLVLMDVQMPFMDGKTATRKIRRLPGWTSVPIVAMTANAFAEDRAECLVSGMDDFVAKPFVPEELYSALLRWLPHRVTEDARS